MKKFSILLTSTFILFMSFALNAQEYVEPTQQEEKVMTPETLLTMARVGNYSLSPDGTKIVYTVTYPNIKKNNSKTYIYTISINGNERKKIAEGHSVKWIKNGESISFLKRKNGATQLFSILPSGEGLQQITNIKGGISDYLISPDEKQLLYVANINITNAAQKRNPDLDKASGKIYTDLMYKHWDEWVTSIPHIFLANIESLPINNGIDLLEGEPFEAPMKPFSDMHDVAFTPDGKGVVYASRKKTGLEYSLSTNSDIFYYDIESKKTNNLTEGMMGYDTNPVFSPDGSYMAWISMERDGYESDLKRLFIMNCKTKEKTYLTSNFECDIDAIQWSKDGASIFFESCIKAEKHLFEITLNTKEIRQITKGQVNYIGFEIQNGVMIAARQSMLTPTDLYSIDINTGKALQITNENKDFNENKSDIRCEKRWMTTTNNEQMLVWIVYPANFDPTKKYPSILYCQGGPQSAISQFWSYRWNPRIMAENGYIVILPNRHGVPSFGKAWNEQISKDYGGQNMLDYMTAADEMKKEPYIDPNGMGCVGASYGGFSVYWLAGHHNKRFNCFIAHAGIFNIESQYLETEEKWFANWDMGGAPWEKDNKIAQRTFATSPHKFIDKWDTPILIIHGEHDFRILASQGMMAFDAARLRGIPTEMLIYPDESHWVLQPQNALLWQRTFFSWLDKWLKK